MQRPSEIGAFQFVILASLRAIQLTRGCRPRVDGDHKTIVTAQMEVSQGKVMQDFTPLVTTLPATPAVVPAEPALALT